VSRIPLPLPGDGLHAVNVYLLETADGLVMIDGGWATGSARAQLEQSASELGYALADIREILVTHVHRDHYTLAVELRREFGMRVSLGEDERASISDLRELGADATTEWVRRLTVYGAHRLAGQLATEEIGMRVLPAALEFPDRWLESGARIDLGDRTLDVLATPGHTRGHVVFIDGERGAIFAGDHVLPHITPSVGIETRLDELSLHNYIGSLKVMLDLPALTILPAHGPVGGSSHDRTRSLLQHHDDRLAATLAVLSDPATAYTAYDVASALPWTRREKQFSDLDLHNQLLATAETAAHLEQLRMTGDVATFGDGSTTGYWTRAPARRQEMPA
jgi:glyoxylase-like metal-dependent hydrolase (beta-lactamase superfamily II)